MTNGKIKHKTYLVFLFFVNCIDIEIFLTYFVLSFLFVFLSFFLLFFLTAISEDMVAVQVSVLVVHLVGTKMVKVVHSVKNVQKIRI